MAFTALMFVILIVSFALMFGFVRFTENVIADQADPADDGAVADAGDAKL